MNRLLLLLALCLPLPAIAAIPAAPPRAEGEGPYPQLILRGATVITGTGAPAYGPVDIVIEGERIVSVSIVGSANAPIDPKYRPVLKAGGREIDLAGQFVMPGLVDMHGHIGGDEQGVTAEYVYKLWLAHGITSVRDPGCGNGIEWCVSESRRSAANAITAPRIEAYGTVDELSSQIGAALARALANDPAILLADEPTGNLDSSNGRHIMDLLLAVNHARRTTLVLVTHDAALASLAEVQLALRDGRRDPDHSRVAATAAAR